MPRSFAVGEFADEVGVHTETVKRWCRDGDLDYARTPGGDRRIPERELRRLSSAARPSDRVALYARVPEQPSTADAGAADARDAGAGDATPVDPEDELGRQLERLEEHAGEQGWTVDATYADVGSGLDEDREGLQALLDAVPEASYGRVLVAHDAALARHGDGFLDRYLDCYGVSVTALEAAPVPPVPDRASAELTAASAVTADVEPETRHEGDRVRTDEAAPASGTASNAPSGAAADRLHDAAADEQQPGNRDAARQTDRAIETLFDAVDSTLESYAEGNYEARTAIDRDGSKLDDELLSIADRVDDLGRELGAEEEDATAGNDAGVEDHAGVEHDAATDAEVRDRTRDRAAALEQPLDDADRSLASLSDAVSQLDDRERERRDGVDDVLDGLTDLADSVDGAFESIADAEAASDRVAERAAAGRSAAERTTEELTTACDATAATQDDLESLRSRVDEIDAVVEVIDDIADETHVLALNAQIEAARADESAAGFGVVAEEVKSLAADARENAGEIGTIVRDVRTETERTAEELATVSERVAAGLDAAGGVHETLPAVEDAAVDAASALEQVAEAVDECDEHVGTSSSRLEALRERLDDEGQTIDRLAADADETVALLADLNDVVAELQSDTSTSCGRQD